MLPNMHICVFGFFEECIQIGYVLCYVEVEISRVDMHVHGMTRSGARRSSFALVDRDLLPNPTKAVQSNTKDRMIPR